MNQAEAEKLLVIAENIATEAHKGQKRHNGEPFIEHPKTLAADLKSANYYNYEEQIVAWLHDVIEDSDVTFADLLNKGIPFECVVAIEALTKGKGEIYLNYLQRVATNKIALKVKLVDLSNNILDCKSKHQKDKYLLAQHLLRKVEA